MQKLAYFSTRKFVHISYATFRFGESWSVKLSIKSLFTKRTKNEPAFFYFNVGNFTRELRTRLQVFMARREGKSLAQLVYFPRLSFSSSLLFLTEKLNNVFSFSPEFFHIPRTYTHTPGSILSQQPFVLFFQAWSFILRPRGIRAATSPTSNSISS